MKRLILIVLAAFALNATADAGIFKKKSKAQTEQSKNTKSKKGKKGAQAQPQRPAPRREVRPAAKPGLFNVQHY